MMSLLVGVTTKALGLKLWNEKSCMAMHGETNPRPPATGARDAPVGPMPAWHAEVCLIGQDSALPKLFLVIWISGSDELIRRNDLFSHSPAGQASYWVAAA